MARLALALAVLLLAATPAAAADPPADWLAEWPDTDFARHAIPFEEIFAGGPPKDGIPAIDAPSFVPVEDATDLDDREPVIGVIVGTDARAYPLRVLIWHEIVNDKVGGIPVAVTFCPLCNAAIVFDRRIAGRVFDFGTTGKLRNSDLVMYDRQTESWWQQFTGEAIVGEMTGTQLSFLPSRLESWAEFRKRAPDGAVLVPDDPSFRPYGINPYVGYDQRTRPYEFYRGPLPDGVPALSRVVSLGDRDQAWSFSLVRDRREIVTEGGVTLRWQPGQSSALDQEQIAEGEDVGTVTATREGPNGPEDVAYFVDYAFAFHAFHPDAPIHTLGNP